MHTETHPELFHDYPVPLAFLPRPGTLAMTVTIPIHEGIIRLPKRLQNMYHGILIPHFLNAEFVQ